MPALILDGECHNGQYAQSLGPGHWRFEARGDTGHYCYYFQFTLNSPDAGEAVVEVAPDRELMPESAGSFRRHRPEFVWLLQGGDWKRHPVEPDGPGDCLRIRVKLGAGETVTVSRMRPLPYSAVAWWVEESARRPEVCAQSLGASAGGRDIAALEVGTGERPVLALAGQHPAEFGGTQAVLGIAEWLLSSLPEAREARARYRFTLVPVLNPDGNVQGRCGHNGRGQDLYRSFPDAARGEPLAAAEAAHLWAWIERERPALSLNFHCFTQPSPSGSFPWEGMYTAPDEAFVTEAWRAKQRRLDDRLAWETDGLSQSGQFALHLPAALEYQLARREVLSVFYETQDAVGVFRQRRCGVQVLCAALRTIEAG
jgi:zinc carboxypeptidase